MWPVVRIAVIIGNSNPSLCIFAIWRVARWQRSIRRRRRPEDDDRNDVDKHHNNDDDDDDDDNDDDDDDDHRGAVETIAGESDGADCYLALFDNTTIRYVVAAMV